jgi:trigger factor
MSENIEIETQEELFVKVSTDNIASINVSLEEQELEPYKKKYIQEKKKTVVLRGFRKGKAPEEMVARYFKEEAREVAKDNLIYGKYMKLLQDHRLKPLADPTIKEITDENGKIDAILNVEVLQPVVLDQYLGLEVKEYVKKDTREELKKTIVEIKQMYPKLTAIDTPAENGNVVVMDFTMTNDTIEIEKQKDFKMSLGINAYFKEFEDQIVGVKTGENKEFSLTFPDTYAKDELKNKLVNFAVSIKAVQTINEYTNEELAKLLGYENEEKMTEQLTKELEAKDKDDEHLFYENQILGQLLATHQFNIPKTIKNEEIRKILVEKPEMKPEEVEKVADNFIRTDLILHAIYERHPDQHMTQEQFNEKIGELANKANDTLENVVKKLQDSGKMQSYMNYLVNCKTIDFLIEMSDKNTMEVVEIKKEINDTNF